MTIILGAGAGSEIANRIGFKPVPVAGILRTAVGLLRFTQIQTDGTFVGGALGLAVLSSLAASKTDSVLNAAQGAQEAVPGALTEGFQLAFLVSSGFALVGAVIALAVIRTKDSKAAISAEGQTETIG